MLPTTPTTPRAGTGGTGGAVARAATPVLAAAALVLAAAAGGWASAVVAVALSVGIAAGWPTLLALPSPRGTRGVVLGTGVAAALAVATTPDDPWLRRLPVVLALAVLAACAHQLLRRDLRPRVVDSLGGTLLGAALAALGAGWVALAPVQAGWEVTAVVAVGSAVACLLLVLPLPATATSGLAVVGAAGAAAATAAVLDVAGRPGVTGATAAVLGALVALVALCVHLLLARLPAVGRSKSQVALVAGSLAPAGTAAYALGRLLLG